MIGSSRTTTAADPEAIASEEIAAIGEARGVETILTEIDLTDRNSPGVETDPSELTVLIKWIESNALNDQTIPAVDAIDRSEALSARTFRHYQTERYRSCAG